MPIHQNIRRTGNNKQPSSGPYHLVFEVLLWLLLLLGDTLKFSQRPTLYSFASSLALEAPPALRSVPIAGNWLDCPGASFFSFSVMLWHSPGTLTLLLTLCCSDHSVISGNASQTNLFVLCITRHQMLHFSNSKTVWRRWPLSTSVFSVVDCQVSIPFHPEPSFSVPSM